MSIKLRLSPPYSHRLDARSVPGFLTQLAGNAGEGYVAVGPTDAALPPTSPNPHSALRIFALAPRQSRHPVPPPPIAPDLLESAA